MIVMTMAMLLAWGQESSPRLGTPFETTAPSCAADGERLRSIVGFFELRADQTIAEYQPDFVLTDCIADTVAGHGRLVAVVDGGDGVVQVSRRIVTQKAMKRDAARYGNVPLLALKPGKAVPAERAGSVDRILMFGAAPELVRNSKRGAGLLRALRELAGPDGQLGIVDAPDADGVDIAKLASIAREAGWEPAGQTITGPAGLLLLKYRKS